MITLKRTDGSIIAECDTDIMVEAVEMHKADLQGANLHDADLWRANLQGADLQGASLEGADLHGADLSRACNILSFGPIGSEGRIIYVVNHGDKIMVQAGCFWGDLEDFKKAVEDTHGANEHGVAYMAAIEFIKAYAKAYKWSEEKDQ